MVPARVRPTWARTTTWGTLAAVASLAATVVHGAPASDRLGGDELDAVSLFLHGQGQEHYIQRRQAASLPTTVVTQTVFSTFVQTATQTLITTVLPASPQDTGAAAAAPAASGAIAPSLPDILSSLLPAPAPSPPAPPAPIPAGSSSSVQPTPTSAGGNDPLLFIPSVLPDLSTPTLMPSSGAENNRQQPAASSKAVAPRPTSSSAAQQKPLMMAYFPEWTASVFPPENVDFGRYDWVDFAFAVPQQDASLGWDGSDDAPDLLRRLVDNAHRGGKKVKLSVGGWTGSKYFSSVVSGAQGRQTLASNILATYNQFNLDGIDIDWEFPGQGGNDQNTESPKDSANYLLFLQLLRRTLPPAAKITAAVMTVPWADANGNPLRDVSGFAQVLDWVLIMNYDTWGSSSTPGPDAPLSNACHNSTESGSSAVAGVSTWTAAGFPASKIVMGMPSYGYISRSTANYLQGRSTGRQPLARSLPPPARKLNHVPMHTDGSAGFSATSGIPLIQSSSDDPGLSVSAAGSSGAKLVVNEDGGTDDGQVQFRDLVKQGVLQYIPAWSMASAAAQSFETSDIDDGQDDGPDDGQDNDSEEGDDSGADSGDDATPDPDSDLAAAVNTLSFAGHTISNVFTGLAGFERKWDACSSTPYLRSTTARQVVTYDDPQSLEMKATFARYAGLRGVNMFDIHGDTDQWDLTDALRRGLGL